MTQQPDIAAVAREFDVAGRLRAAMPYGAGHINDTFRLTFADGGATRSTILQRINRTVFHDPRTVMENIERVTTHQRRVLERSGCRDPERRALSLVRTRNGRAWHADAAGNTWRMYRFIESARPCALPENPRQAFEVARAFGEFHRQLADLPGPPLHETIPGFHDTPARFRALEQAVAADPCGRAEAAAPEIAFALRHRALAGALAEQQSAGRMVPRTVHNDTKTDNVLLDEATGEALCVTDLDTVMPGLVLYDFGDLVRSATRSCAEDETDLSRVGVVLPMFAALVRGYAAAAGDLLNGWERASLALAGQVITLEIGLRFLTDHLLGDTYFRIRRPDHNRDRCRVQFRHLQSMLSSEPEMLRAAREAL